jgi:hypothetical protein
MAHSLGIYFPIRLIMSTIFGSTVGDALFLFRAMRGVIVCCMRFAGGVHARTERLSELRIACNTRSVTQNLVSRESVMYYCNSKCARSPLHANLKGAHNLNHWKTLCRAGKPDASVKPAQRIRGAAASADTCAGGRDGSRGTQPTAQLYAP